MLKTYEFDAEEAIRHLEKVNGKRVTTLHAWFPNGRERLVIGFEGEKEDHSICFAADDTYNYAVCVGWHYAGPDRTQQPDGTWKDVPGDDGWRTAWKIGRQTTNNIMQSDFDIDFELPYGESGDLDDTLETIEVVDGIPSGYASWADLAKRVRSEARRVWNAWREDDR